MTRENIQKLQESFRLLHTEALRLDDKLAALCFKQMVGDVDLTEVIHETEFELVTTCAALGQAANTLDLVMARLN